MGQPLTKYVSGSKTVDIQYDGKGIRVAKTSKIGTSVTTNSTYIYDNGGKLRTEIEGSTTRNYIYGADGVVGYEENGEHFMYRKNFFSDITAIYRGTTKVAEYTYDAWGNCTITLNTSGYGSRNPFRYRGYYWDEDLKMYYLMTRYYDPKTGRFINADSIEYLEPDAINGLNLYAYCKNNPVMFVDPVGTEAYLVTIYAFNFSKNHTGIPIVGHSMLFFKGENGYWYMTEYSGSNKANAAVRTVKVDESSLRKFMEKEYLPSLLELSNIFSGIDKLPFGIFSIGYSVVPIDGDYSAFNTDTKIEFEENYNLMTNNCCHYVISWLAQNYTGELLSKEFFDTINLNPVPAISSAVTGIAMAFSWVANEIQGLIME